MPIVNGIELIKSVYSINKKQLVMVLSAHSEKEYLVELINIGICKFILKPIDYETFLDDIFNISKTIKSSIELLNITNKKFDCDFEFKLDEKLEIFGVESELSQVIINILTNSYEAFERKNIEKKIVQIKLERIENNICLNIIDNAGGVEDSIIDKIFDPYFTTKHKFQGTGLGLFVCSQIVIEHFHGNITCENILKEDEKGCRFLITFPIL